jgi:hypothetical protein
MRRKVISCAICALMIATVLVIEVPKDVSAQVTEEWARRYGGSDPYDYYMSEDIACGPSGNVYVTGTYVHFFKYSPKMVTVAYDSHGNELWVAEYNWSGGVAIAVDSNENIIVTGLIPKVIPKGSSNFDIVTIKYDINGNELWVSRYNGSEDNVVEDMVLDSSDNIYITGWTNSWPGNQNYTTIAYDPNGNELWSAVYNGPENRDDRAIAITTDSCGNVYVTGEVEKNHLRFMDYVTIAYDSAGDELWVARYDGGGTCGQQAKDIVADANGNVYVTGSTLIYSPFEFVYLHEDFHTVAYDSYGNELWVAIYNGPKNKLDSAEAITIGPQNYVYVTGWNGGSNSTDYATIAYDPQGHELWVANYDSPNYYSDSPKDIVVDSYGYVYVTGNCYTPSKKGHYATVAYDPYGNELWAEGYNYGCYYKGVNAIAIDQSRNVYVTGYDYGIISFYDYLTIKYSQQFPIDTTIAINPSTLNLKSKGKWITTYITLPEGYNVKDIDITTVILEDTIPAEWGDIQGDTLMVKFDRSDVEDMLSPGTYNLKVTGELTGGTSFEGYSDEIRVIEPPGK